MEYGADELGCIRGGQTTDRIVKVDQYAKAGIGFCLRIAQAATGVPMVYTYVLDRRAGPAADHRQRAVSGRADQARHGGRGARRI